MKLIETGYADPINGVAETKFLVTDDAEYLDDHFPNAPMFPGAMMLEIAVQLAARLVDEKKLPIDLDLLENFYLLRCVVPDETLFVRVVRKESIESISGSGPAWFQAEATVEGERAMRARFRLSPMATGAIGVRDS